jgi:hypothetical protein
MSSPETYSNWLARLTSEQFGRLWYCKFQYDLKHGNVSPDIENTFRSIIESKLKTTKPDFPPLALIKSILLENPSLFDLQGLRVPQDHEPYSTITNLEAFSYYLLKRRVLITILDEAEDELDFIWANIGGIITPRFFKGNLRTDRAFFWCAATVVLDDVIARHTADQAAITLRDRLGLHHMDKGQRLIRIDIPENALVSRKLCAPTTADSGENPAFIPFNSADGYGRTLNLKTIRRDVKEIVAEEIQFDETFTATRIGEVSTNVPPISWAEVEALVR